MMEWQPIETVPNEAMVLVFNRNGRVSLEYCREIHDLIKAANIDGDDCFYTHWMPLPDPPNNSTQ